MLPNPQLKAEYDKVIWVYVYRDFSKNEADRAAERISMRFGVTSWPQLFLVDPSTMKILKHTGRQVESFQRAVKAAQVPARMSLKHWEALTAAEARAKALEKKPTVKLATAGLEDDDIVVRTRSLEYLAGKKPAAIAKRAKELLQVPNDPFRYAVCKVLQDAKEEGAREPLEAIVADPKPSLNPNVLRIRAVQALSTCGDARSVDVIAPHAQSGAYFNGLTRISIDALATIAARDKKARKKVDGILREAYPNPPKDGANEREMRACVSLARHIHKKRGDKRPFPKVYDDSAVQKLRSR